MTSLIVLLLPNITTREGPDLSKHDGAPQGYRLSSFVLRILLPTVNRVVVGKKNLGEKMSWVQLEYLHEAITCIGECDASLSPYSMIWFEKGMQTGGDVSAHECVEGASDPRPVSHDPSTQERGLPRNIMPLNGCSHNVRTFVVWVVDLLSEPLFSVKHADCHRPTNCIYPNFEMQPGKHLMSWSFHENSNDGCCCIPCRPACNFLDEAFRTCWVCPLSTPGYSFDSCHGRVFSADSNLVTTPCCKVQYVIACDGSCAITEEHVSTIGIYCLKMHNLVANVFQSMRQPKQEIPHSVIRGAVYITLAKFDFEIGVCHTSCGASVIWSFPCMFSLHGNRNTHIGVIVKVDQNKGAFDTRPTSCVPFAHERGLQRNTTTSIKQKIDDTNFTSWVAHFPFQCFPTVKYDDSSMQEKGTNQKCGFLRYCLPGSCSFHGNSGDGHGCTFNSPACHSFRRMFCNCWAYPPGIPGHHIDGCQGAARCVVPDQLTALCCDFQHWRTCGGWWTTLEKFDSAVRICRVQGVVNVTPACVNCENEVCHACWGALVTWLSSCGPEPHEWESSYVYSNAKTECEETAFNAQPSPHMSCSFESGNASVQMPKLTLESKCLTGSAQEHEALSKAKTLHNERACAQGREIRVYEPVVGKMKTHVERLPSLRNSLYAVNLVMHSITQFFQDAFCNEVRRVGEAENPGPFIIATFNPTQLLGREEEIASFNDGIWTGCETSHTTEAQEVTQSRFRAVNINSVFSKAAEKHSDNNGIYRGKAVGTAIMSRFPMQPYPEMLDHDAFVTCRFTDAIVRLSPNLPMYVCAIYGPPENNTTLTDAESVFVAASRPGIERAVAFKGPAVITGDFNRELHEVPFWPILQNRGWVDCAMSCHQRYGTPLDATCRDRTTKSFILVNPVLRQYMTACETAHEQMFDSHPVLQATFDMDVKVQYRQVWSLPRSIDDIQLDAKRMNSAAIENCHARRRKFQDAIDQGHGDDAIRQFALAFEESAAVSCVDAEGRPQHAPAGCWKRCRNRIKKLTPVAAPMLKQGGSSDFCIPICQPSISVRRHVKQLRRVQSLSRQLEALERNGGEVTRMKCNQLWIKICEANGFEHGFQTWVLSNFHFFVPTALPAAEYVQALYLQLQEFVKDEVTMEKNLRCSFRRMQLMEDIGRGGRLIYRSVRDATPPPPSFITFSKCQKICSQRWKKEGNNKILYENPCVLEEGMPVQFQGQSLMLERVDSRFLYVNPPAVCRDANDMKVFQENHTSDPKEMQEHVANAWSELWQNPESSDDDKSQVAEFITALDDCPSCPYKPFSIDNWKQMMRGVKCRSARGACGFSMMDVKRMPNVLLEWLFCIYKAVEDGMGWPKRLTLARVAMLAKPGESVNKPLGIRPITILSVLYRLWSRYRSLQVLEFLGQHVPPQVGGIASKISADILAAMVGDVVDVAHTTGEHRCGLVIDLQKCFNLVPRWPLQQLLSKLGVPQEYINAHMAMLHNLNRYIDIAGQIGDEVPSSCGVPEGCAASVTCMVAFTVLAAKVMQNVCPSVLVSMFADNWAVIAHAVQTLVQVIQSLEQLVHCLGMKLSPGKSWLWGTSQAMRKELGCVTMNGQKVPVQHSAKDLGCDMAYTKQTAKKTCLARLKKSLRVLKRVKRKKVPKNFMGRMCTTVGVGIVSYGSELVRFTNKQFHSLRCAIASSLGLYRSGANALLATSATGLVVDPQVRLLRSRLKFFRRFFKIFPGRKEAFLHRITKHVSKNRVSGISAHFHCALRDTGWRCEAGASIVHETGIRCNWVDDSIPYIFRCLDKAWEATVCTRIQRKGFDLPAFSVNGFRKLLKD